MGFSDLAGMVAGALTVLVPYRLWQKHSQRKLQKRLEAIRQHMRDIVAEEEGNAQ